MRAALSAAASLPGWQHFVMDERLRSPLRFSPSSRPQNVLHLDWQALKKPFAQQLAASFVVRFQKAARRERQLMADSVSTRRRQ